MNDNCEQMQKFQKACEKLEEKLESNRHKETLKSDEEIDYYLNTVYFAFMDKTKFDKIVYEFHNPHVLKFLIENKELVCNKIDRPSIRDPHLWNTLRIYQKISKYGICKIPYRRSFKFSDKGRLYAHCNIGMQSFPREIRLLLNANISTDIDLENCHPTILAHLCEEYDIACKCIREYRDDRDKFLNELKDANGLTRARAKEIIIAIMNGSRSEYKQLNVKTQFIEDLFKSMKKILKGIRSANKELYDKLADIYEKYKLNGGLKYKNTEISTMAWLMQDIENSILMTMLEYFGNNGLYSNIGVLIFDGCFLPKNKKFQESLVDCEKFIAEKLDIKVTLKIKSVKDKTGILKEHKFKKLTFSKHKRMLTKLIKVKYFKETLPSMYDNGLTEYKKSLIENQKVLKIEHFADYKQFQNGRINSLEEIYTLLGLTMAKIGQKDLLIRTRYVQILKCDHASADRRKVISYQWDTVDKRDFLMGDNEVIINVLYDKRLTRYPNPIGKIFSKAEEQFEEEPEKLKTFYAEVSLKTVYRYVLARGLIIKTYNQRNFIPVSDDSLDEEEIFNAFEGFYFKTYKKVKNIKFEESPVYQLIKEGISADDKKVCEYIIKWIAHLIQKTYKKPDIGIVLTSLPGVGKSLFALFLINLIGESYTMIMESDKSDKFNKSEANKLLLVYEEPDQARVHGQWNQYKHIITRPKIQVRPMYGEKYMINDYVRCLFLTNEVGSIKVDPTNRRLFIQQCSTKFKGNFKFFGEIDNLIHDKDFLKGAFDYFNTVDISTFVPQRDLPPTTAHKLEKENQLNLAHKFMKDVGFALYNDNKTEYSVEEYEIYRGRRDKKYRLKISQLSKMYKSWCDERNVSRIYNRNQLKQKLQQLGMKFIERKLTIGRSKYSGYAFTIDSLRDNFRVYTQEKDFTFALEKDEDEKQELEKIGYEYASEYDDSCI